jgi:hypothetical protein
LRQFVRYRAGKDSGMPLLIYLPFIIWSGMVAHMCDLQRSKPDQ